MPNSRRERGRPLREPARGRRQFRFRPDPSARQVNFPDSTPITAFGATILRGLVQIAKSFGAEVTGVCSAPNVDMVRAIGAGRVIDYTREDFTTGGEHYDLILDCIGNHSLSASRRVLNREGKYIGVGGASGRWMIGPLARVLAALVLSRFGSRKLVMILSKLRKEDLTLMGELMEAGKVTPVIDRRYSLSEAAEAVRYLEGGHARGKVMITVA